MRPQVFIASDMVPRMDSKGELTSRQMVLHWPLVQALLLLEPDSSGLVSRSLIAAIFLALAIT